MKFEIYRRKDNDYGWTLKAANGRIIADSAEGYRDKDHAKRMIAKFKTDVPAAPVEDKT